MTIPHYDIIIAGGGLVGALCAQALKSLSLNIALVENVAPDLRMDEHYDMRSLALARVTQEYLRQLGLWTALEKTAVPIEQIRVCEEGSWATATLKAQEIKVDSLGQVVPFAHLNRTFWQTLMLDKKITVFAPDQITQITHQTDKVVVQLKNKEQQLSTQLLIIAEGGHSSLRNQLGIGAVTHDYEQSALVANVSVSMHNGVAYERFLKEGAMALLPLEGERYALIWVGAHAQTKRRCELESHLFLDELQATFGSHLGTLTRVGERQSFPLTRVIATEQVRSRVVLLGNAAHMLHPIAGQGFNLSVRDVKVLAETLQQALHDQRDVGDINVLREYCRKRQPDQQRVDYFIHGLVSLFSVHDYPLPWFRRFGLQAFSYLGPFKHRLMRFAIGG